MPKVDDLKSDDDHPTTKMERVGTTTEGFGLWRRREVHGGYSYWTDEIPPALQVYEQGLDNPLATFEALEHLGTGKEWWLMIGKRLGYLED